jgi:hypothetical protein
MQYYPICDDFGPMNMSAIVEFITLLEQEMAAFSTSRIVYCVCNGARELTNAIFLLGSCMLISLDMSADDVSDCFSWAEEDGLTMPYRDATFSVPDFGLTLLDCWRELEKGRDCAWIRQVGCNLPFNGFRLFDFEKNRKGETNLSKSVLSMLTGSDSLETAKAVDVVKVEGCPASAQAQSRMRLDVADPPSQLATIPTSASKGGGAEEKPETEKEE